MDKEPNFALQPSLQEMAVRRVVVNFWSAADVFILIKEFPFKKKFCGKDKLWEKIVENKVKEKIVKFVFPEALKRRMYSVMKPIGLQIPEWKSFMEQFLCTSQENLDMNLLKYLCWTSTGAIHYERTAEKLASLQTLDIVTRFKIACEHCLLESLPVVWKQFTEVVEKDYLQPFYDPTDTNCLLYEKFLLQIYWTYVLMGESYKSLERERDGSFYLQALKFSALRSNKPATKYFFQKLSFEERDYLFLQFHIILGGFFGSSELYDFPPQKSSDAFCYLLSQISPEKQIQTLGSYPEFLFEIFLNWRWQNLFLEKTQLIWSLQHDARTYKKLLLRIGKKIYSSNYYFPEMLREFNSRSPRDFKRYLVNQECQGLFPLPLFCELLGKEDKETVKELLRNLDAEDKTRLVSCLRVFQEFNNLLVNKRHYLVELCVREACQSKENRQRLKEIFMGFLEEKNYGDDLKKEWQRFFDTLDKIEAIILKKRSQN